MMSCSGNGELECGVFMILEDGKVLCELLKCGSKKSNTE